MNAGQFSALSSDQQYPWPSQQGSASLQVVPTSAQPPPPCTVPQVPLVWPAGTLHTKPLQQSEVCVQVASSPWHGGAHTPPSQLPEQHWLFASQARPFGTQDTHFRPVPASRHRLEQHDASPPVAQLAPVAVHSPTAAPHLQSRLPGVVSRQKYGAQHWSLSFSHVAFCARHTGALDFVQCSTPVAGSGTHGAPLQHWSLNWQTLACVKLPGLSAGMQQAGSFAS